MSKLKLFSYILVALSVILIPDIKTFIGIWCIVLANWLDDQTRTL